MSSFDILLISISIAILSPFVLGLLIMLGGAIILVLSTIISIAMVIWDNICRLFKAIKKLIREGR